ncbi:lysophospholipid acyltransferase family protein [Desulfovibrio litoralis]|uniref:1-acyl-sn-glycerol-3-phosphate acyltransferase n=1 Tax=Desulfovibrio litoralis DSM 11393 TaxID=1121455 RepID=A0A1M7STE6_9BACT|nr:lysophospholipid acyltransferase family protein [Desulfovibrio litoralis]SHN61817.1 1-acyl-sn-glycerol-3-phosphate acyltransferase [Desulfovibrio litoralis DSM 11393]
MKILYSLHCIVLTAVLHIGLLLLIALALVWGPFAYCYFRFACSFSVSKSIQHIIWWHGKTWAWLVQLFIPVTVINKNTDMPDCCIVALNHQSFYDPYCIAFTPIRSLVFIVGNWPFSIPIYNVFMIKAGYLNSSKLSSENLLSRAKNLLDEGTSVVCFPEGTRSKDGKLGRFHGGIFHLSVATMKPIVPICIDGTGRLLRKGAFLLRPTNITITILPSVDATAFLQYNEKAYYMLRKHVKLLIENELQANQTERNKK